MEDKVLQFVGWIYNNYGRAGCAAAFLIIVSILVLAFVLLNRLPEPKTDSQNIKEQI